MEAVWLISAVECSAVQVKRWRCMREKTPHRINQSIHLGRYLT
jgi:hypothetical protein